MPIINATDLNTWSKRNDARDKLGELLRKLIHENTLLSKIKTIRFLANESNQLAGWDGILECQSQVPWVPSGTSVWELGTGYNIRQKIKDDFYLRQEKELPFGWDRKKTTYFGVTLRKLNDHVELENELKSASIWHTVKVVDAQTLEEWIEVSPVTETWLQEQEIGPNPKVYTLRKAWRNWSETTQPPIIEKLILAGRDQIAEELRNKIINQGDPIHIQADSPEEVIAFIYSTIQTTENEIFREHFLSSSIVINHVENIDRFLNNSSPLNIILRYPATEKSIQLAKYGHKVINAFGSSSNVQRIDYYLLRPSRPEFTKALVQMNRPIEKSEIEARACGTSPSIWRVWNLLENGHPGENIPDWAKKESADTVIPIVLLGGWSEKSDGDKEIIEIIREEKFNQFRNKLNQFIVCDNPLLIKAGDAWVVSAPATAFALTIHFITQGHLELLTNVVKKVFEEIDPTIDLPPDERYYAGIRDIKVKHSEWLRNGLAESLLRIAVIGQKLEDFGAIPGGISCQSYVDGLIKALPGLQKDWRLLASLRNQLPVLMEAAPIPFIEALEGLLQGQIEKIKPLFEEGEGIYSHPFHSGLLWGLETLAWEPKYIGRVGLILAKLAEIDPGGKLANRPFNSLRDIFLAWHPGTNATLEQRLDALDLILTHIKKTGWRLICSLMPKNRAIVSPTHSPFWKDFGKSNKESVTKIAIMEAYRNYIDKALNYAGKDISRWTTLIDIYNDVSSKHQHLIEENLKELSKSNLSKSEMKSIWETLRRFINRHKEFPNSSWSLPSEKLEKLEGIKNLFGSSDPLDQGAWLFNDYFPDIPFSKSDFKKAENALKQLRSDAIKNIYQHDHLQLLKQLINLVAYPGLIAPVLIDILPDENSAIYILIETNQGTDHEQFFAKCLSGIAYEKYGDKWTKLLLSQARESDWSSNETLNVFMNYRDSKKTFDLIESLGKEIKESYWIKRSSSVGREDNETLSIAIDEFANHGRAISALYAAASNWDIKEPDIYLSFLDQALKELNENENGSILGDVGYWIEELFVWLSNQKNIDKSELARKEYAYLPLLTGSMEKIDLTLHEFLAKDPTFFIEILCDLYKPASGYPEGYKQKKDIKIRAEFAWKILNSWKQPPGIDPNGKVNSATLKDWVLKARELAKENDRLDIADQVIGQVLYYIPVNSEDELWPHIEIRNLLETIKSKDFETGIELEQHNSRGTFTKKIFDGGSQERTIAQMWRDKANKLGIKWPRTHAMLEKIADSWEANAKWEDERAEKNRLKFR